MDKHNLILDYWGRRVMALPLIIDGVSIWCEQSNIHGWDIEREQVYKILGTDDVPLYGSFSYMNRCAVCGVTFLTDNKRATCCTVRCRKHKDREYQKYYRRNHYKKAEINDVICQHCNELFKPKRKGAKFCSVKCRVAAHRERKLPGWKRECFHI